jgi:peptidoglycan/xylan/chitin deacetylase (PgdA/CDA1 family)
MREIIMNTIALVWTNDDISVGLSAKLREHLALIERFGLKGSFFVIPESGGRGIDQDAELLREIESARSRGHEFHQHGYVHTPFESGVPETWMLDYFPAVRQEFDVRRLEIEKLHTMPALLSMLEAGHTIWESAFHEGSLGYRPAWGAFCGNLYRALDQFGFQFVSSRISSPTSWLRNNGLWEAPIDFRAGVRADPHPIENLIELPVGGEYAFRVPSEGSKIASMIDLAMQEMEYCHERGWPMMMVCHWVGLERNGGTGYAVHEQLIPKLLASGKVEPMTMSQLCARTKARLAEAPPAHSDRPTLQTSP